MTNRNFFVLTEGVRNPQGRPRSKSPEFLPIWPAGTLCLSVEYPDGTGYIDLLRIGPDQDARRTNSYIPLLSEAGQALRLAPSHPAQLTLGLLRQRDGLALEGLLAYLVETGVVSMGYIDAISKTVSCSAETDAISLAYEEACNKHGV